jgi:hypothetical protein
MFFTHFLQMIYFDTFRRDIFRPYIAHFAKQKITSSPFPSNDPDQKEAYLKACSAQLGLDITADMMRPCPTTRAVSKLFLNCLWGKLSEKRYGRTIISSDREEIDRWHVQAESIKTGERLSSARLISVGFYFIFLLFFCCTATTKYKFFAVKHCGNGDSTPRNSSTFSVQQRGYCRIYYGGRESEITPRVRL